MVDPGVDTARTDLTGGRAAPARRPRSPLRSVAVPTEHGGWSLTLEPVLLGLLVAWSWPGFALGAAAMVAFVARTPLKVVLVDRWRGRRLDRTRLAVRVAAVELAVLAVLVAVTARGAAGRWWVPLALAAPLVAVELWFDMRSRSRYLVPELAGTVGMGSVAAAIVLVAGGDALVALGLWCVVAARSAAAIPYVRAQLRRGSGRPPHTAQSVWQSDLAQVVAVVVVAGAWLGDAIPLVPLVVIGAVAGLNVAALRLPPRRAVVIGIQQSVIGLAVVVITALAMGPA